MNFIPVPWGLSGNGLRRKNAALSAETGDCVW
jgi:hypothetical protein